MAAQPRELVAFLRHLGSEKAPFLMTMPSNGTRESGQVVQLHPPALASER
jgi:hypothetical protein